jgi:hypothetical protein
MQEGRRMGRSAWWTTIALVGLLGAPLGCGDDDKTSCGDGTELVAGECLPIQDQGGAQKDAGAGQAGSGGATCGMSTVLDGNECQGQKPIGAGCTRGRECATGTCLPQTEGLPGGYCSVLDCNDNRPCPAGSLCHYSGASKHFVCLAICDADDDCRADDYVCQPLITNDFSVCAPSCNGDGKCPNPTRCDDKTGRCVLDECVPDSNNTCDDDGEHICYADTRGLTESGGICLTTCDPAASAASCAPDEKCQPLPEDPEHSGFCTPPICSATKDCPAGATCQEGVCQPPARCDEQGKCADASALCVADQCMPACPGEDGECSDIHPGLECSTALGACLPIGSFPGSPCRDARSNACDSLAVTRAGKSTQAAMVCEDDRCLVDCTDEGAALCGDVDASLTCASGIYAAPVCLPIGAFPGGPCAEDETCAPLEHGNQSLPMSCAQDRCAVTCDASNGGDTLCASVDESLVCAADLFGDGVDLCLPRGSFPGGPCGAGSSCDEGMSCQGARCLYDCSTIGDDGCAAIRSSLTCAEQIYDVPVCLPKGSFPGGACAEGDLCAPLSRGGQDLPMTCKAGKCLLTCDNTAGGDAFCAAIDGGLVCADNLYGDGIDLCLPRGSFPGGPCGAGKACDTGMVCEDSKCLYDCTDGGNAYCGAISGTLACATGVYPTPVCLPKGSFPGGPCGASNFCASDLKGVAAADMRCQSDVCVVKCDNTEVTKSDGLCEAVSPALTCVDSAGAAAFCALKCGGGNSCTAGNSCFTSEDACLPTGSFLGSPCATGNTCIPSTTYFCVPSGTPVCALRCNSNGGAMQTEADAGCAAVPGAGFTHCQAIGGGVEICQ